MYRIKKITKRFYKKALIKLIMKKKINYWKSIVFTIAISILFTASCSKKDDIVIDPPVIEPPVVTVPSTINSLMPNSGPAETEVTIAGTNFGNNPSIVKVIFGTLRATLISVSNNEIKVKVPPGTGVGNVNVFVSVGSTASNKLDFTTYPLITDLNTTCFYNSTVVINGSDFSPNVTDNIVKFGAVSATVISATTTNLRVKTPNLGAATNTSVTVTSVGLASGGKNIVVDVDQNKVATYNWTTNTVKPGVTYKSGKFSLFGTTMRSIYVLDVSLNANNSLGIGFSTTNAATTNMCNDYNAVAGVNAGYFPFPGASDKDPYIRINGATVQDGHLNVSPIFTNAALIINNNVATIMKFTAAGNNLNLDAAALPVATAQNVIVCGPILITADELEAQNMSSTHNTSSAARTGIGVTADGKRVFMVVIDTGAGVTGVTTPQLAKILQALGAVDAMNLDGGGSSTMFVKDLNATGLANAPSGGTYQRPVRSVIYVK